MKGKKGKKDLQQQAWIGGGCTVDEGLLSARKLKSNVGSNFSHAVVLSPPLATWPSPIWPVSPCPFTLSYCNCHHLPAVFGALDKFSFFFSPFISNLCRTMSTAISPSPPPTP